MASEMAAEPTPVEILTVGMSVSQTCGVRAHAGLLAEGLVADGARSSQHWLTRSGDASLVASRSQVRAWVRELRAGLESRRPDAVLLHYSVFSYSYRGVPLFVHATLSALRAAGVPVITVLHELAYPWRHGGWRGKVWALTQRAQLAEVMHASSAVIVTADFRVDWLASRPWFPRRPALLAPVFSNLPRPSSGARSEGPGSRVGLFGYSYEGAALSLVLDAIRSLRDRGLDVELRLLGAPGRDSAAGRTWLARAQARGVALSFSEALPPQALSDELAACDVLLFADSSGPSSRKGTLAGSLASGRPVVAIDGRRTWQELVRGDAARVVAPTSGAVADAVAALLGDDASREALGARGRAFAEREMGLARTVGAVQSILGELRPRSAQAAAAADSQLERAL